MAGTSFLFCCELDSKNNQQSSSEVSCSSYFDLKTFRFSVIFGLSIYHERVLRNFLKINRFSFVSILFRSLFENTDQKYSDSTVSVIHLSFDRFGFLSYNVNFRSNADSLCPLSPISISARKKEVQLQSCFDFTGRLEFMRDAISVWDFSLQLSLRI